MLICHPNGNTWKERRCGYPREAEGHVLPTAEELPKVSWHGPNRGLFRGFFAAKKAVCLWWGERQMANEDWPYQGSFLTLLKLFPTVAGTSAGQEGGEVTGEGFHLWASDPAHKQAQRQNPDLQGGHTALSQEGLPEWIDPPTHHFLPAPTSAVITHFPLLICWEALERWSFESRNIANVNISPKWAPWVNPQEGSLRFPRTVLKFH